MRRARVLLTVVVATAACSDTDPASTSRPAVESMTTTTPAAVDDGADALPDDTGAEAPAVSEPLSVSVSVEGAGLGAVLDVEFEPADLAGVDPFGRFVSCSGLRRSVGAYSVLVSDPGAAVTSVSVLSVDRVSGPGIFDADVRIERRVGGPIDAVGTMTLDDDLRSGSFVAFDPSGEAISGSFECLGEQASPRPLELGLDDGVVDTVEVFVLLRRDGLERVVGLAVDSALADATVECPAAADVASDLLVRVAGDQSVGALTEFELVDDSNAVMRMQVGGAVFGFDDVAVTAAGSRVTGTFSAVMSDGVSADGAFSCS